MRTQAWQHLCKEAGPAHGGAGTGRLCPGQAPGATFPPRLLSSQQRESAGERALSI